METQAERSVLCFNRGSSHGSSTPQQRVVLLPASAMSVQLASFLIKSLCDWRGLCLPCPVSALVQRCRPGSGSEQVGLDAFLSRPPWKPGRSGIVAPNIRRLASLVSSKGSDILLKASTEAVVNHDRFRTTILPHLWKFVCGWKWKYGQESEEFLEHSNRLELRACLTSIRWRIGKQRIRKVRFLHLVDSLVSLPPVEKCNRSSRKYHPFSFCPARSACWVMLTQPSTR